MVTLYTLLPQTNPNSPTACHAMLEMSAPAAGLGRIDIQVRLNLDQGQFLALYLVWRTNFGVSLIEKILFACTTDMLCDSLDTEPVSWLWFADPHFVVLSQPCPAGGF